MKRFDALSPEAFGLSPEDLEYRDFEATFPTNEATTHYADDQIVFGPKAAPSDKVGQAKPCGYKNTNPAYDPCLEGYDF